EPLAQSQILQNLAVAGMVRRLDKIVFAVVAAGEAGHDRVGIVAVVAVRDRSDQAYAVQQLGKPRQVLADLHAGHGRSDGTELAANFRGSIRLRVQSIEMTWPAKQ